MGRDTRRSRSWQGCCCKVELGYKPSILFQRYSYNPYIRAIGNHPLTAQYKNWAHDQVHTAEQKSNTGPHYYNDVYPNNSILVDKTITDIPFPTSTFTYTVSMIMSPVLVRDGVVPSPKLAPPPIIETSPSLSFTEEVRVTGVAHDDYTLINSGQSNSTPVDEVMSQTTNQSYPSNFSYNGTIYLAQNPSTFSQSSPTVSLPYGITFTATNLQMVSSTPIFNVNYLPYNAEVDQSDFTNEVTLADEATLIKNEFNTPNAGDTASSSTGVSFYSRGSLVDYDNYTSRRFYNVHLSQFRLSIPNTHEGDWCEIKYEIVLDDGNVQTVESTETMEWSTSVPFSSRDADDYLTGWTDIELPDQKDHEKFVRITHYRFRHHEVWKAY